MNQDVENQIGGANIEASRVTPEEIAELFREPDVGPTSLLDLFIAFLLVLVSGLTATLIAWWVL